MVVGWGAGVNWANARLEITASELMIQSRYIGGALLNCNKISKIPQTKISRVNKDVIDCLPFSIVLIEPYAQ